jgi:hypothetical protein
MDTSAIRTVLRHPPAESKSGVGELLAGFETGAAASAAEYATGD